MLLKDCCEILYSLPVRALNQSENIWLSSADMKENNVIDIHKSYGYFDTNSCLRVRKNDILLKRINPTFVNVYDTGQEAYLGNNLLIIRSKKFDVYYLAYIIEQNLTKLNDLANSAKIRLNAVNRELIGTIDIPDIQLEQQTKIGEVWRLGRDKQKLLEQLQQKEKQKRLFGENKIFEKLGGNKNGRN